MEMYVLDIPEFKAQIAPRSTTDVLEPSLRPFAPALGRESRSKHCVRCLG